MMHNLMVLLYKLPYKDIWGILMRKDDISAKKENLLFQTYLLILPLIYQDNVFQTRCLTN